MKMTPKQAIENRSGTGSAFGTFGELVQGVLPDNDLDFLVTLPIARYARARFRSDPSLPSLVVHPPHKQKSLRLATTVLDYLGLPQGGTLEITSELPEGKGLASSSADLVATVRAIEDCFGTQIPVEQIERFMLQIEPSDGVMYDGITCFYHRQVRLGQFLGTLPSMTIVGSDEGGEVDTIAFNHIPKPFTSGDKAEYRALLDEVTRAIPEGDLAAIGRVATLSAVMNQKLRPKQYLDEALRLCRKVGALGVAVAHSGTYVGILLSPVAPDYRMQVHVVQESMRQVTGNVTVFHTLNFDKGASNYHAQRHDQQHR